jgi:hypothetical protein
MQEEFERTAERIRTVVLQMVNASPDREEKRVLSIPTSTISAVLLPLYNSFADIRDHLHSLMDRHGQLTEEELTHFYWYQFLLNHLETNNQRNGVWVGELCLGGFAPAGQAALQEMLEAVHRQIQRINEDREVQRKNRVGASVVNREKQLWKELKCQIRLTSCRLRVPMEPHSCLPMCSCGTSTLCL